MTVILRNLGRRQAERARIANLELAEILEEVVR